MKLTFYSTPGHGYLRVPKSVFLKMGGNPEKITSYSGHDVNTLYLEEDCDATYFLDLLKLNNVTPVISSRHLNNFPVTHNYSPDTFFRKLNTGDVVKLHDNRVAVVHNEKHGILLEIGYVKYKLPITNPYKYIKEYVK